MFSLCVTLMFSVRSEIVITGVGMNSLCNFTKYYSCEISLNVNFKTPSFIAVISLDRIHNDASWHNGQIGIMPSTFVNPGLFFFYTF